MLDEKLADVGTCGKTRCLTLQAFKCLFVYFNIPAMVLEDDAVHEADERPARLRAISRIDTSTLEELTMMTCIPIERSGNRPREEALTRMDKKQSTGLSTRSWARNLDRAGRSHHSALRRPGAGDQAPAIMIDISGDK